MLKQADGVNVYCAYDEMMDTVVLVPNPRNPNQHPEKQIELLAKIIQNQGWRAPITISNRSGFIVRGHGRLRAAKKLGLSEVPVDRQDYANEAEEWADLIADNRISELSQNDDVLLKDLLEELDNGAFDMDLTGFDADEIEKLMTQFHVGEVEEDDFDAEKAAAEIKEPVSKPGDVWKLGRHRLMCGDSTKAGDVKKLLGEVQPLLMVTDPPYGVEYDPDWRNKTLGESKRATGKVSNDEKADWHEAWALFPGDVAYVWHAGRHASAVQQSLETAGFEIRCQIIWAKTRFAISRGHYHWQHEPCWYAVRKGGKGHWSGDRSQTTLWTIDHKKSETGHSTQKPVECMLRPILNNSSPGQAVYDPFVGSGTTIIAAEQSGRVCYAMELDPIYCDVIIQRFEQFTGQKAELLG